MNFCSFHSKTNKVAIFQAQRYMHLQASVSSVDTHSGSNLPLGGTNCL